MAPSLKPVVSVGRQFRRNPMRFGMKPGWSMRRYVLATLVAAFMVVVAPASGRSNPDREDKVDRTSLAAQTLMVPTGGVRDEAAMVLIGTALIAVAAAVRRAA